MKLTAICLLFAASTLCSAFASEVIMRMERLLAAMRIPLVVEPTDGKEARVLRFSRRAAKPHTWKMYEVPLVADVNPGDIVWNVTKGYEVNWETCPEGMTEQTFINARVIIKRIQEAEKELEIALKKEMAMWEDK